MFSSAYKKHAIKKQPKKLPGYSALLTRLFYFMEIPSLTCKKCGTIDEVVISEQGNHVRADCRACGAFIKFVPQGKPPVLYFGKYKGREISTLKSKEEVDYLNWVIVQTWCQKNVKKQIEDHLKTL